jgi:DNA polymerase IV
MLNALFIDFNAYFAAAEQHRRPALRGHPVVVVPTMALSTSCIASSQEARRYGIKTGTKVSEALGLCPRLQVIESDPAYYLDLHQALKEVIDRCVPVQEVRSVDEMLCHLTGPRREVERAVAVAQEVKRELARQIGPWMTCSIGISVNEFLAKTASDMEKPNGLVVLEKKALPGPLLKLALRDLCGIGAEMEQRLRAHGICSLPELWSASVSDLHRVWGSIQGDRFHARLHGEEVYLPPARHTVVGHSHVLPPSLRHDRGAFAVLGRLTHKAAARLRRMGYHAARFSCSLKAEQGGRWGQELRLAPTRDTLDFLRALHQIWTRRPESLGTLQAVGVTLSDLHPDAGVSESLFPEEQQQHRLQEAMDALNQRFGKNTVYFGGMHQARDTAPMRIAFHHLPDRE